MKKVLLSLATIGLSLSLVACSKPTSDKDSTHPVQNDTPNLSIGYQKAALKLIVAKQNKIFEQTFPNTKIEWKEFPAGPQTLEALSVNAIGNKMCHFFSRTIFTIVENENISLHKDLLIQYKKENYTVFFCFFG